MSSDRDPMSRWEIVGIAAFLIAIVVFLLVVRAVTASGALFGALDPHRLDDGHIREMGEGQIKFDHRGPENWAMRWRQEHRAAQVLRRRLRRSIQRSLQSAVSSPSPVEAIRLVFGPYADQALRVAQCESGLNTYASNGQYEGLFQMGSSERARFGHGPTAIEQARAAYVYFWVSGRSWGPWSCRP